MQAGTTAPKHFLLAEHDRAHALLMRERLINCGDRVTHARKQSEAIRVLSSESFDAIVLDVELPDGDGFDIQAWLLSSGCGTPIVSVTSDDLAKHAVKAPHAGAIHWV